MTSGLGRDVEFIIGHVDAETVTAVVGEPQLWRNGAPA